MKKALSILICLAVLAMTLVAVIPASADATQPNIMALDGMDYQYYFAGDAATVAPDITDGIVTPGEYGYSEDWANVSTTPHTSYSHPNPDGIEGIAGHNLRGADAKAAAGTDIMNVNIAYDADWVYIGIVANSPRPNDRGFGITISNPNPTTYSDMLSRLFYWTNVKLPDAHVLPEGIQNVSSWTWGPRNYRHDAFGNQVSLNSYRPTAATEDFDAFLTYDATAKTQTFELKIKKTGLATAFDKEVADINQIGLSIFHVYTNDVENPVYQDDFKISYFMQLLDDTQSALLEETYDLDITPAWVPYYINLGNEADFTTAAPVTTPTPTTAAPATNKPTTNKPAATTTEAPATTTAAPAATTAAEEKGCGGVIGLSAIALVPAAVLGMAIATKKKED